MGRKPQEVPPFGLHAGRPGNSLYGGAPAAGSCESATRTRHPAYKMASRTRKRSIDYSVCGFPWPSVMVEMTFAFKVICT